MTPISMAERRTEMGSAEVPAAARNPAEAPGAERAAGAPDVETETEAEAAAAATTRALVRADGEGWLGRLAGGVVHELKNPLSTIHLNLELLRDEWARAWAHSSDPRERRSLKRLDLVLRETRRLDAMLKDFLRFTRADRVVAEPVDLPALVDEVLAFVVPECTLRRVEVRREYDATLGAVRADPMLLKQAVLNLVLNAQDAMTEHGGTLTVRVARSPDGGGRGERTAGEEAHLEVADTGTGIAPGELSHLFELYRTTKPDGTGLGLATTKRIAEAHGGRIEVESTPGAGSRFRIALPLAAAGEAGPRGVAGTEAR